MQDGRLWSWTLNRTGSISSVFARIKNKQYVFPRAEECGEFLDDFTCEIAEFDDHLRSIKFICPENRTDDALHATNYAQAVGLRLVHAQSR